MAKEKKKMEVEDLARIVQAGFESVKASFASAAKVNDDRFKIAVEEFDRIRSDIRDIKTTLGPLVRMVALLENDSTDLQKRVGYLERLAGVDK